MRVWVISDTVGPIPAALAANAVASAWSGGVAIPAGAAGAGFAEAYPAQLAAEVGSGLALRPVDGDAASPGWRHVVGETLVVGLHDAGGGAEDHHIDEAASSVALGELILAALHEQPQACRVVVDLSGVEATHDGGAGLLAGLGAVAGVDLTAGVAGLAGLDQIDLKPVRARLADVELVGVVRADQVDRPLLGLRGLTSLRRGDAADPERLLRIDASLAQLAGLLDVSDRPGLGAAGGAALAITALGGRLTTGPELALADLTPSDRGRSVPAVSPPELVVAGCSVFDFADRGGEVVTVAARLAERSLCPAIVVAGEVLIGGREMRTLGIESAYPVRASTRTRPSIDDVTEAELAAVAQRVARSWRW